MTYGKRPPLDEEKALFESQVAREGTTTGAGAPAGNSFFDAALIGFGANSFVSMLAVVYPGQPNLVDSFDITAFDNAFGEVTLSHNYKGGQIPAGAPYKIVTFRFVPAEVAAIAAALAAHEAAQLASRGEVTSIETKVDAVEVKLDTPANFMADVSALALEASLGTHDTDIKALLATIAGYIDAEVAAIITSQARMLFTMDFWSNPVEEKTVSNVQTTDFVGAPVVVAGLPAGATIVRAIVMFKFRMVENTNVAENSLDCTAVQPIQVDDSVNTGWVTCIDFVDEQFKLAGETREGGDVLIGDNDVSARVDGNDTYDFQWLNVKAHLSLMQFNDIQMGIRIWYSV